MKLSLPLNIERGNIQYAASLKQAIDMHLDLMLTTPLGGSAADPEMGFILNNLKFEIFDEKEGVVLDSTAQDKSGVYDKKLSGSSRNMNTFAIDLKNLIEKYENRLSDLSVTMSYIREHKKIYIVIKGTITKTGAEYKYQNTIDIWS